MKELGEVFGMNGGSAFMSISFRTIKTGGSRAALLCAESATERQEETSLKRPKAHHAQLAKDLAPVLGYLTPRKVFTKLLNGMGASPA